jgi:hypothetical protein
MAHRNRWFTYQKWWFSMAMLNNQMVFILGIVSEDTQLRWIHFEDNVWNNMEQNGTTIVLAYKSQCLLEKSCVFALLVKSTIFLFPYIAPHSFPYVSPCFSHVSCLDIPRTAKFHNSQVLRCRTFCPCKYWSATKMVELQDGLECDTDFSAL